eukprot:CAMPEP_0115541578 /NCGR_PEP_ID=MMETSP0271-20121206/90541_1 /TAXON_ID=71861 /ORGANISM="Scrippsiella trochoidea, Strain CCMP3099" /LENGTH=125 /DNA_ID=CAMNT_0002974659 /DNA_START=103 /DNA_END=477 /DNA_ORIENTATION=-
MAERFKVVSIACGSDPPRQFVVAVGEILVIGRAPDCDVVTDLRGASGRHLEFSVVEETEGVVECRVMDVSTNGTGICTPGQSGADERGWLPLRNGQSHEVGSISQVLLPFNRKTKETTALLTVRV